MNNNKTLLITGAAGFLGSNLSRRCLEKGYSVLAYKRPTTDLWRLKNVIDYIQWYDIDELSAPFEKNKITHIIHTATLRGSRNEKTSELISTNLLFPLKIYELASDFKVETFFNADTVLHENLNAYALSKKQFNRWLCDLAGRTKVVNIKLEHIYGPDDDNNKFITCLIEQLMANVPEVKLTMGEQKIDFMYIDDVVEAYLCLLNNSKNFFKAYNNISLGSGVAVTIRDLVDLVAKIINSKTSLLFGALPYRANELMMSQADIAELNRLGWFPKYSLEEGIRICINYRREGVR
jgi:CDP-paratose synthetase